MPLDPAAIYKHLTTSEPMPLHSLSRTDGGLFALYDHLGVPRYIGRTKDADSFHRRIQRRHVTGTEEPSHRFAYAYNVGRMWRRKGSGGSDAKVAKALRTSFIRQYCCVVVHTVLPEYFDMLPSLEGAVFDLVPAGALSWSHGTSIVRIPEPTDLVGRLLDEMSFPEDLRQAVERQASLYASS